jgi:hypothetical protein
MGPVTAAGVNYLRFFRVLAVIILLDALVLAIGHAPLALGISPLFRQPERQPPPQPPASAQRPPSGAIPFSAIGVYFLFATIAYILGGIFVLAGRLLKLSNVGLIILAVIDNLLLIYTRTMSNIFFPREIPWSWTWFPPGTVQILIGQTALIVLCAILLHKPIDKKFSST